MAESHQFWKNAAWAAPGVLLADELAAIGDRDQLEVASHFSGVRGRVLELGAGNGRFTGHLARAATSVVAVDFIEDFITQNRNSHADLSNIDYLCANVMDLRFESDRFDFVLVNWLMMYLSDADCTTLISRLGTWLGPDGEVFLRESCVTDSTGESPTDATRSDSGHYHSVSHYRQPEAYEALVEVDFEILEKGHLVLYEDVFQNNNQCWWRLRRMRTTQ